MTTPPDANAAMRRWAVPAAVAGIVLAAVVAYANSLGGPFLFDDTGSIVANPSLRQLWPIGGALSPPFAGGQTVGGRPVLNFSFAVNYALGGLDVRGYHATNLLLHLLAGLVLFGVVRRTLGRLEEGRATFLAFAIALLWTVHPLQTEAVTYTVQRAESLMGLFYLLTLYGFIRGAEGEKAARRGPGFWYGLSWLACLFGMGSKEVMASAPVIVFLYDRTFLAGSFGEAWRRRWRVHAALASTWLLLGWLVWSAGNRGGSVGTSQVSWGAYALTQFPAIVQYLRLSIWPSPLIFDYGAEWVERPWSVLPAALAVAALLVAAAIWLWRRPALGFLAAWFLAILAPTSLMPGNRQTLAEHRMYLALIPVVVAAVWFGRRWLRSPLGTGATLALGVVLALATAERNTVYRSDLAIWSDTAAKRPNNPFAHNNLGVALFQRNDLAGAKAQYDRALALRPDYPEAHLNLGNWLVAEGRPQEALAELERGLQLNPLDPEAYNDRGLALRAAGRGEEAIGDFARAVQLRPQFAEARVNLGNSLGEHGRLREAMVQFAEALRIDPRSAEAHYDLGTALLLAGRPGEAVPEFEEAIRLRPDYSDARRSLEAARQGVGGGER